MLFPIAMTTGSIQSAHAVLLGVGVNLLSQRGLAGGHVHVDSALLDR